MFQTVQHRPVSLVPRITESKPMMEIHLPPLHTLRIMRLFDRLHHCLLHPQSLYPALIVACSFGLYKQPVLDLLTCSIIDPELTLRPIANHHIPNNQIRHLRPDFPPATTGCTCENSDSPIFALSNTEVEVPF